MTSSRATWQTEGAGPATLLPQESDTVCASPQVVFRDYIWVSLLIAPAALRLLLPISWEVRLSISVLGVPLFLPELAWGLAPLFYRRYTNRSVFLPTNFLLLWFASICLLLSFPSILAVREAPANVAFVALLEVFGLFAYLCLFPPQRWHESGLRWSLLMIVGLLVAQIVLFSLGIATYRVEVTAHEYGGVGRLHSTVGAATGTGHILFLLAVWCGALLLKGCRFVLFALMAGGVLVAIILLQSRGPVLMVFMLASTLLLRVLFTRLVAFSTKTKLVLTGLLVAGLVLAVAILTGAFQAFLERLNTLDDRGDGRLEVWSIALSVFADNPWSGVGPGAYFGRKRFILTDFLSNYPSPHNYYLLLLVEFGLVAAAAFTLVLWWSVLRAVRRYPVSIASHALLAILLVGLNVEVVYIDPEFSVFFFGLILWMLNRLPEPSSGSARFA